MLDTNVILDDILNRARHAEAAKKISQLVVNNIINGYVTANSITDIYYIACKYCDENTARIIVRNLLLTLNVVVVEGQDCLNALDLPLSDYEDALIVACADKAALPYIITNDTSFLQETNLSVPSISPTDFLMKFEKLTYGKNE
jgi:predicted nucleic acid-binding protein